MDKMTKQKDTIKNEDSTLKVHYEDNAVKDCFPYHWCLTIEPVFEPVW